ncbi:MAG: hypothetical protein GC181_13030 [Bacteroidetes bacterium]|nr:hypothetical protein [Bacteroidota bacterium]
MTIEERQIREIFLDMLSKYEVLSTTQKKSRHLHTTKVTEWISQKLGIPVKARLIVKLFETEGYEYVFEKGGIHHWVKS